MKRVGLRGAVLLALLLLALEAAAFELASWNAKRLGWGESRDWEASAAVIAGYEFVALQEVMTEEGVERLEQALEQRTGAAWESLISSRSVGRGRYQEHYAFLWQAEAVEYTGGAVLYLDPGDLFEREPFAARFRSTDGRWRWTAATVHLIYGDSQAEREREARELDEYVLWLEANIAEGTPVLLMGDFNLPPGNEAFDALRDDYRPVITEGATTLSSHEGRYANLYDQIYLRPGSLPVRGAWIDRFPQRLGVTHERARAAISDHAPVVVSLTREGPEPAGSETPAGSAAPAASAPAGAAVTVVCAHPDAAGRDGDNLADEYVVLANPGDEPVDLAGWTLMDGAGHRIALDGTLVAGGQRRITSEAAGRAVWNNDGDTVELLDARGERVYRGAYPGDITLCR